jgi:nicotinamide-nucleotide amidase
MSTGLPPLATAEIIAVGSELLGSTRLDTNSLFLSERLSALGIDLRAKSVVGDRREDLATLVRRSLERVDLLVLTGGLGPTDDDLTREVVSGVLGRPLHEDPAIVASIAQRFERRGLRMPEVNRRQAMVPEGAVVLANPNGSAPGLYLEEGAQVIVLLPGPPRELQPMFDALAAGRLGARAGAERFYTVSLFVAGLSESHVEEAIQPIYSPWTRSEPPIETTILAAPGQIEVHLRTRRSDPDEARAVLERSRAALVEALGDAVFSLDRRSMEEVVGDLLRERGLTLAAGESCTGGLLLSRLTDVAGSSAYVAGGVTAYSNAVKIGMLGVPADLIAQHGAVSEPVASAMAQGARSRLGTDVGIGITGIAGPDGGSPQKPVGTVAIAVDAGRAARVRTFHFTGVRTQIKFQASQAALDMLRRLLLEDAALRRD